MQSSPHYLYSLDGATMGLLRDLLILIGLWRYVLFTYGMSMGVDTAVSDCMSCITL